MNVTYDLDPIYELSQELDCIQSDFYYELAVKSIMKMPKYIWFVPASSSGKYHPKSSLGIGGLLRHIKAAFAISEELLKHPLYAPFSEDEKDEIRIAILLHDACKQGINDKPEADTRADHPLLVRKALQPWDNEEVVEERVLIAWDRICNLIETHMGIWTKDKKTNEEILKVPETKAQLFVHECDYLASRPIIEVDINTRKAQKGYKSKSSVQWKDELATPGQVEYIKKLYVLCKEKNVYYPPLQITDSNGNMILKKGEASDTIQQIKALLGIK